VNRTKALKLNAAVSLLSELVTLITGLILPRLILLYFGSSYNGLVGSISQFLGFSVVLRAGLGGAVRAALYKPLAESDTDSISGIMAVTQQYMRKVGLILGAGIIAFAAVYPFAVRNEYNWFFTFSLVVIMGVGVFTDNFFGIKCKILLQADQKYYIQIGIGVLVSVISSAVTILLVLSGYSIHTVRIGMAACGLLNPLLLTMYVKKHYQINWKQKADGSVIKNKWNAFFQQLAVIVNGNVDLTLLTFLVPLREISVYTVHFMVVNNIGKIVDAFSSGVNSTFGDMIARKEQDKLRERFFALEWLLMALGAVLYSVTLVMLPSFLRLYTRSVEDVNYIRPLFALLMVAATMLHTSRLPYQLLAEGAGKFKETRNGAILEVVLNVVLSITFTMIFGLEGVLIATLIACAIRTAEYAVFCFKNILHISVWHLIKHYTLLCGTFAVCWAVGSRLIMADIPNYFIWTLNAGLVMLLAVCVVGLVSVVFYRAQLKDVLRRFRRG